ncbi:MAG TPA: hypothetical protein VMT03_25230 [Polyangia bacterium]|nr:hypothetical protein [Polyangia bacterium]
MRGWLDAVACLTALVAGCGGGSGGARATGGSVDAGAPGLPAATRHGTDIVTLALVQTPQPGPLISFDS